MRRFLYKHESDEVTMEIQNMDLKQAAEEVGIIAERLYISLKQQSPDAADYFKTMVVLLMTHPDSPIWSAEPVAGDVIAVIMGKKPE